MWSKKQGIYLKVIANAQVISNGALTRVEAMEMESSGQVRDMFAGRTARACW